VKWHPSTTVKWKSQTVVRIPDCVCSFCLALESTKFGVVFRSRKWASSLSSFRWDEQLCESLPSLRPTYWNRSFEDCCCHTQNTVSFCLASWVCFETLAQTRSPLCTVHTLAWTTFVLLSRSSQRSERTPVESAICTGHKQSLTFTAASVATNSIRFRQHTHCVCTRLNRSVQTQRLRVHSVACNSSANSVDVRVGWVRLSLEVLSERCFDCQSLRFNITQCDWQPDSYKP